MVLPAELALSYARVPEPFQNNRVAPGHIYGSVVYVAAHALADGRDDVRCTVAVDSQDYSERGVLGLP